MIKIINDWSVHYESDYSDQSINIYHKLHVNKPFKIFGCFFFLYRNTLKIKKFSVA